MHVVLLRAFRGPSLHTDVPTLLARVRADERDAAVDERLVAVWLGGDPPESHLCMAPGVRALGAAIEAVAASAGVEVKPLRVVEGPGSSTYDFALPLEPEPALRSLVESCAAALDQIAAGLDPRPAADIAAEVREVAESHALGPSTRAIVEAAERRGIPWERLDDASLIRLGWGRNARLIRASVTGQSGAVAVDIACDKPLASRLLAAAGLPVPRGEMARSREEAVAAAERIGYPVVVKPRDGNHGRGVSVGLDSAEAVAAAFDIVRDLGRRALVEEQFVGRDFRVLVVGGRVVAAAERRPARVVGDGRRSIAELVAAENEDPRRGDGHELEMTRIRLDDVALAHLAAEGHAPDDVPAAGETISICRTANLSRGASAHDVTDDLHPTVRAVCERAARVVGLDVCGVDLVAPGVDEPIPPGSGIVEVNASPGLRMHLAPAEGHPRDVGGAIVEHLFPDDAPARVPVIAVTGTNGKTTTTRLIAHVLAGEGHCVGMTCTGGITVGGVEVATGDTTGPNSARIVLADPAVDVAVLETARGGIVRRGLAFDLADVAVLTNVTEDHVGQDGIRDIEDLYRIKRRVAERVRPGGCVVLNADDDRLARLPADPAMQSWERRYVYFSTVADSPIVTHHRARGGSALFARAGWAVLAEGEEERYLFRLADAPLTMRGAARFQSANVLAATAALIAHGVEPARVAAGVRSFGAAANAGRANLFRVGDGYVMLDYGHNPAGYAQVCRLAAEWRRDGRQVVGIIAAPGDRPDETIRASAAEAAAGFSRVIVREDADRRGREPGEVSRLLHDAVSRAAPDLPCEVIPDAADALRRALPAVHRGAVAVLFYEKLAPLVELLASEGAEQVEAVPPRTGNSFRPASLRLVDEGDPTPALTAEA